MTITDASGHRDSQTQDGRHVLGLTELFLSLVLAVQSAKQEAGRLPEHAFTHTLGIKRLSVAKMDSCSQKENKEIKRGS